MRKPIEMSEVLKVYTGKAGCMCGCKGRYWVTPETRAAAEKDRGYEYEARDVNESKVRSVVRDINNELLLLSAGVSIDVTEQYVYVEHSNGRCLAVYFK